MPSPDTRVRQYKATYAFTPGAELDKTVPLAHGERLVLEARIQSRSGRFTVGTGILRLTDRRLLLLSHRAVSSDSVTEIPRDLIRGIQPVTVDLPLGGGKRRAIALSYDGEPAQGQTPFWAYHPIRSLAAAQGLDGGIEQLTEDLYDALLAALYPSGVQAQAAPEQPKLGPRE
jgi:hypothetical protein